MHTVLLTLITIVGEPVLADTLITTLHEIGATGHTLTEARGQDSRGIRASDIPGDNVRIETTVSPARADRILALLATAYFPHYAIIGWATEIHVVRGEKYA